MFSTHVSAVTQLLSFTSAVLMYREKKFDVLTDKRCVTNSSKASTTTSLIECAMLCAMLENCCSASYYDGNCSSNSNCYPVMEAFVNSFVIRGDCKTDKLGLNYDGIINTTITGRTCQAWALDVPHIHGYHSQDNELNYCRNPTSEYPGPWCYTTDPDYRWEFCPVYECGTTCGYGFFLCDTGQCILDHWRCNGISDCPGSEDESNCDNVPECLEDSAGLTYRGKVNVTESGITCQHWSSQIPWAHGDSFLNAENYCRNFESNKSRPWCYTLNTSVRWQYCDIPDCD